MRHIFTHHHFRQTNSNLRWLMRHIEHLAQTIQTARYTCIFTNTDRWVCTMSMSIRRRLIRYALTLQIDMETSAHQQTVTHHQYGLNIMRRNPVTQTQ